MVAHLSTRKHLVHINLKCTRQQKRHFTFTCKCTSTFDLNILLSLWANHQFIHPQGQVKSNLGARVKCRGSCDNVSRVASDLMST
eukprot:4411228-Amphidinium_carterae.2